MDGLVWAEAATFLDVGPDPGSGNSEGGLSDGSTVPQGHNARAPTYFETVIATLLHTAPEPGPGNSEGGGFD